MLDRLERRAFIKRRPNPDDRRGVIVEIDEEYSKNAQSAVSGIERANQEVVASFSEDELAIVASFLTRMAKSLSKESKRIERGAQPG